VDELTAGLRAAVRAHQIGRFHVDSQRLEIAFLCHLELVVGRKPRDPGDAAALGVVCCGDCSGMGTFDA